MSIFNQAMKYFHRCGFKVSVIRGKYFIMPFTSEELQSQEYDLSQIEELRVILNLKPHMCADTNEVVKSAQKYGFTAIR